MTSVSDTSRFRHVGRIWLSAVGPKWCITKIFQKYHCHKTETAKTYQVWTPLISKPKWHLGGHHGAQWAIRQCLSKAASTTTKTLPKRISFGNNWFQNNGCSFVGHHEAQKDATSVMSRAPHYDRTKSANSYEFWKHLISEAQNARSWSQWRQRGARPICSWNCIEIKPNVAKCLQFGAPPVLGT